MTCELIFATFYSVPFNTVYNQVFFYLPACLIDWNHYNADTMRANSSVRFNEVYTL